MSGTGGQSTPIITITSTISPTSTPSCDVYCFTLKQPGIAVIGRVNQTFDFARSRVSGGPPTVVLGLPMFSSFATQDMLTVVVQNPPFPIQVGDYLNVIVTPTTPPSNALLALRVDRATLTQFENQNIEYQGIEDQPVICPCNSNTLVYFFVNNQAYQFRLTDQTMVRGFGSPGMIPVGSKIDVLVHFQFLSNADQSWSYTVLQVANPDAQ
ncbi:MAG TPA: hypothetical protein VH540_06280 [Ktedonobacterales bacterium]